MKHRPIQMQLRSLAAFIVLLIATPLATAETITATLTFRDSDNEPEPLRFAKVEIWRLDGLIWHALWTVDTNEMGVFTREEPFTGRHTYALRVFATNPAAEVFQLDLYTVPFFREPGRDDDTGGAERHLTASAPTDVLDFSFEFKDNWARNHFNVADAILRGKQYADERRDPRESDTIGRVAVLMTSANTFYDPISHLIRLNPMYAQDDYTVLHEYAHYLEERISSFFGIVSLHDGCRADVGAVSPGLAWMEGFASYFAQAVRIQFGSNVDGPSLGSLPLDRLESPSCPDAREPPSSLEVFVGGALLDLHDNINERGDELCSMDSNSVDTNIDKIIFQIFDHELDIGWTNPTFQMFTDAWIARGLDLPPFLSTIGTSGLAVVTPAPLITYDTQPPANLAVWRVSAGGAWFVSGGIAPLRLWGQAGDIPVPADYDGDGQTDVAIWRPWDGSWYVIKSATGVSHVTQWGMIGDVPLPADYDGDNKIDYAVYRPGTGQVYVRFETCGGPSVTWIGAGRPVVGDFDGDGTDEPGTYYSDSGWFRIARPSGALPMWLRVGTGGGGPAIADYDGDGRSDAAVYRPDSGNWDIRFSASGATTTAWWGERGDIPVPADYDGDGRADIATWTPGSGVWWIQEADGPQWSAQWGTNGDVPVPAR